MASTKTNQQRQEVAHSSKQFGDTNVEGGGNAHLGDVNINGGLHLHVHAPFNVLSVAGNITQFLQFCVQLLQIGRQLEAGHGPKRESLRELLVLLQSLPCLIAQMSLESDQWRSSSHGFAVEKVRQILY